jgi:hypothetical protein
MQIKNVLAEARPTDVDGEPTRVFSAEHLVALALETGRGKDMARILQFLDAGVLDADKLHAILSRHGLGAWSWEGNRCGMPWRDALSGGWPHGAVRSLAG